MLLMIEGDGSGGDEALQGAITRLEELQAIVESVMEVLGSLGEEADGAFAAVDEAASAADSALSSLAGSADAAGGSVGAVAGEADTASASLDALGASADTAAAGLDTVGGAGGAAGAGLAATNDASDLAAPKLGKLGMAGLVVSAALVGTGVAAVHMAGNFQESMTQLVTGAGESQQNLQLVSDGVLKMASDTGESTNQLSQGLYMIESAGYHGQAGLNVLESAAEGAKVGAADLGTVADATTTVLNDFGSSGINANQTVNLLIATVASGKTHMQDLAGSLSQVLPTAASAKVSLESVMGAMATMTSEGVPAANAATYLRQTLIALDAPSAGAKKAMEEVGLSSDDVAATMQKSLPDAIAMITEAVGKKFPAGSAQYVEALKNISGGSKTMQGMLDLSGDHMATFQTDYANLTNAVAGGKDKINGWAAVQEDFNQKLAKAGANAEVFMIALGQHLLPVAGQVMDTLGAFASNLATQLGPALQFLSTHSDIVKVALGGVAAVLGGVLMVALQGATVAMGGFLFGVEGVTAGLLPLAAPFIIAIAVIAGLVFAFKEAYDHIEPFRHAINVLVEQVTGLAGVINGNLQDAFQMILPPLRTAAEWVGEHLQQAFKIVGPAILQAIQALSHFADDIATRIGPAIMNIFAFIRGALVLFGQVWMAVWPALSSELAGVWEIIKGVVEVAWSVVSGIIKIGLDILGGNWKQAWDDLKTMLSGVWDGIKQVLDGAMRALVAGFLGGIEGMLAVLAHIPGPIGQMANGALNAIKGFTEGTQTQTKKAADAAVMHTTEMKVKSLAQVAEMHEKAVRELDLQRQDLIAQIKATKDPVVKAHLEMRLKSVEEAEKMHIAQAAAAQKGAQTLIAHAKTMKEGVTAQHKETGDVVSTTWNNIKNTVSGAGDSIKTAATTAWNSVTGAVSTAITSVKDTVKAGFDWVKNIVTTVVNDVVGAFSWLYNHNYFFKMLVDDIVGYFKGLWRDATTIWNAVTGFLGGVWKLIQTGAKVAWTAFTAYISDQLNAAKGIITTVWNAVVGVLSGVWTTISGDLSGAWNGIVTFISGLATSIGTAVKTGLIDPITTGIGLLVGDAETWGQNLIKQFIAGVKDLAGDVSKAVGDVAKNVGAFLGFHSPTEKGAGADADKWAPNLVHMFSQGLLSAVPEVSAAAQHMARALASPLGGGGAPSGSPSPVAPSAYGTNLGGSGVGQLLAQIAANTGRPQLGASPVPSTTGTVTQVFPGANFNGVTDINTLYALLNQMQGMALENGQRGTTLGIGW